MRSSTDNNAAIAIRIMLVQVLVLMSPPWPPESGPGREEKQCRGHRSGSRVKCFGIGRFDAETIFLKTRYEARDLGDASRIPDRSEANTIFRSSSRARASVGARGT